MKSHKNSWIQSLFKEGLRPVIEVVEEFDSYEPLNEAECFWIAQFKALGFILTNLTDGGAGMNGVVQSTDTKNKRAASRSWYKHTEETKKKMSESAKGKKITQIARVRCSRSRGCGPFMDQHGNLYLTQGEAAKKLNIRQSHVSEVLSGKLGSSSGYKFTYIEED